MTPLWGFHRGLPRVTLSIFTLSSHVKFVNITSAAHSSSNFLHSRRCRNNKAGRPDSHTAKGGAASALQALAHFSPLLQFAGNLLSQAHIEKNNSFSPWAGVFEARQPASKAADGAALKRGLTWAHGQEEAWQAPCPRFFLPSALRHQSFKNTNTGCLENLGSVIR